jgi:hypothetical protein
MGSPAVPTGPPFDIPPFTISGVLPPYLGPDATISALMCPYETTLVRIASTLCKSKERKGIIQGLLQYRQKLASIGFTAGFQWLSGSFMEDIETLEKRPPNDIDVVTFTRMPAAIKVPADWIAFKTANLSVLDSQQAKAAYKCDAYFVNLTNPPQFTVEQTRYWFGLYSHRRNGLWKGMLQIPLPITQDDADASKLVVVP